MHRKLKVLERLEGGVDDEKFSDVTLNVNGTKFRAHKIILASGSPVFAAMFEHPMKEKADNEVEIEGIEDGIFRELLRFMYSGKVDDIKSIADGLLAAADKYSLEELKIICEETLAENLSNENAVEYLKVAELHNAPYLKKQVVDFISLNVIKLLNLPDLKSTDDCHSGVKYGVFHSLASALRKSTDFTSK